MDHDHDISACSKREMVAGFLISAVAPIFRMHLYLHLRKRPRDGYGLIMTRIVDHDNKIDNPLRHYLLVSLTQGARSIICRHHYNNLLAV